MIVFKWILIVCMIFIIVNEVLELRRYNCTTNEDVAGMTFLVVLLIYLFLS